MDINLNSEQSYFQSRQIEDALEHGKNCKQPRKIVGAFLYEDTTTLMFSRTNYGKSILVFQFAYAAATGSQFDPCAALCNECEPMKVLVVDLELNTQVLWSRHGAILSDINPYLKNLYYLHEKPDKRMAIGFELLDKIEQAAIEHEAKLVIIDNISKLLPDALKPDTATFVIAMLNRIRINTGASILVIGHTTKGNPRVCIQPTDYYGSAMLQNFFNELSFLDMTKDGNFFLCHSKTKHKECFNQTVPVFFRGEHHRFGVGFTFCNLQNIADIQLPIMLAPARSGRSRNLSEYKKEVAILLANGISKSTIAGLCNVTPASITYLLNNT
jgi:RecA-family ATPase